MKIKPCYEKEFLALRYALISQAKDYNLQKDGYQNLFKCANEIGWILLPPDLKDRTTGDLNCFLSNILVHDKNAEGESINAMQNYFFQELFGYR